MNLRVLYAVVASVVAVVHAHDDHDHDMQMPLDYVKFPYQAKYYPGDNDGSSDPTHRTYLCSYFPVTADSIFSGITTFAKLPWVQCLGKDRADLFDIAFIGAPFVRHPLSRSSRTLILHTGHRYLLPSRRAIRTRWYPRRLTSFDFVRGLQRAPRYQPLPRWPQGRRLRRHSRYALRQRLCHQAD